MRTINLYEIYHSVQRRFNNSKNKSVSTFKKAKKMLDLAERFINDPSFENLNEFRDAEFAWLDSKDVNKSKKYYWDDFYNAYISNDYIVKKPIYNRGHLGWEKTDGIVYGLSSSVKPKQIKIGATGMDLYTRLRKMKSRYDYNGMKVEFAFYINLASKVESFVHDFLEPKRVSGRTKNDSLEWFYISARQAKKVVVDAIAINNAKLGHTKLDIKEINSRLNVY